MSRQHQQERSEAVKQMILEAALEIELEDGEDKVTVRRIGEKIGYSTGVIYYHFRDKQDIIDELSRKIDTEAYETVKAFIDPEKTIRENLKCLYIGIATLAKTKPIEYKRIFTNRRAYGRSHEAWAELIKEVLDVAVERGELKARDTAVLTNCLLGYIIGCNILFLEHKMGGVNVTEEFAENIVKVILDGLYNSGL